MEPIEWLVLLGVIIYLVVWFEKRAGKHGRNPVLYGILSNISPIILTFWS
jgi:hypothetical protein